MTNSWMNEDGEPIMDGAAWRFEQQLDMDSADERYLDEWDERYYSEQDEWDDEEEDAPFVQEDQWLDGSYEE